jgi:hypothetical protein
MRDRRFILILAAVATPVVAWLSYEAMVAPAQPEKGITGKKLPRPGPLPEPAAPPLATQPAPVVEPSSSVATKTTPPRPAEAATSVAARKPKAKSTPPDAPPDITPAPTGQAAATTAVAASTTGVHPAAAQIKPRSPEELCADRANFVTRALCESRACSSAEWSAHPTCVKRRELEQKNQPASIMGGGN